MRSILRRERSQGGYRDRTVVEEGGREKEGGEMWKKTERKMEEGKKKEVGSFNFFDAK